MLLSKAGTLMGWKILILAYCGGSYMATTALATTTEAHVLSILQQITGTDQVQRDLDLPLFERHVLDSLGMVELMIQLSDEFGVDISPAEIDRAQWASPRLIVEDMQRRVGL